MRFRLGVFVSLLTAAGLAHAEAPPSFTISTVAGIHKAGFSGDGGSATAAEINGPSCVAIDSLDNLYVADDKNGRVRRVRPDGIIETVTGTGVGDPQERDLPAKETNLVQAYGLTVDANNNLYVFSRGHSKLFKIGSDGIARRIAGTGIKGYSGDGGPATNAQLSSANHMLVNSRGEIIIADSGNQRIRRIDAKGIITTVAGTGDAGFGGDGGPATAANFNGPSALAFDASENLYVADFKNHRIREISTNGIITTVAGTGDPKFNGDEIPATQANIGEPCGVAVDRDGVIYIGDQLNRRVRAITRDGLIHTVAGDGSPGYIGDKGTPAVQARLISPDILCLDSAGNIFIPDFANHMVRKLTRTK